MSPPRRRLGRTDLHLPVLGLGTWGLCGDAYGPVADPQVSRTLQRALDQEVTLFDMAPVWGDDGRSERAVAEAVAERRSEVTYVTRAGRRVGAEGPEPDFSARGLRESCETSLKRLKTDYVDLLLLHNPDADTLLDEDVRATCEALVQEGKVRAWGASVAEVHAGRAAANAGVDAVCLPHNLMRPDLLWSLEDELTTREIGVLVSSPLCHGLLAGRWSAHKGFASNDHRTRRWGREALTARVGDIQKLRRLVKGDILSLASAALRFAASEPAACSVLAGARTPGQLESTVRALGEPPYLPEDERRELRRQAGF